MIKDAEYVGKKNESVLDIPQKFFKSMIFLSLRIVFSPLAVLLLAYLYYEDTRKAFLLALLFYTVLTIFSIFQSLMQIFMSVVTFNLFKFVRKSLKVIIMFVALFLYWLGYTLMWDGNFRL